MNLRRITLRYLGWCPGMEAASGFQSGTILQSLSLPFFGIASTLVILIVGALMFIPHLIYATRILLSDTSGIKANEAYWSLFSILIMLASLVLTNRWFRPLDYKSLKINMKNLVILGFATYALSLIWNNSYYLVMFTPYMPYWILHKYHSAIMRTLIPMLKTAIGFILLKLTSNIVHKPVMNEENTKLVSLALGGMSLTGLISALQVIIDPGPYPTEFWIKVVLPVASLIIPCVAIGLLAYDIFMHKRVRERIGSAVLYIGLASVLFEYIYWIIRRIGEGMDIQRLLPYLYVTRLTSTLDFPAPTLLAIVAVIFGIVLHRLGFGTSTRLKATYSIAIISCALANIYSARALPILLGLYLKDIENLISFGSPNLSSWLPNVGVWFYLTRLFEGFIILAFGILCLAQPRIDFKMETLHRLEPRRRFDLARISRLVLAVLGTIAVLSLLFFVAPYLSPKIVEWKEQYQSLSDPEIYTPLILTYDAPADWNPIAQHSDPAGDHVAPNIMKHGVAVGGSDHIGADILNVTLHSSFLSGELTIIVCLNGTGRNDPTIDQDRTQLEVYFGGMRVEGWASIYYNGECYGLCQDYWSKQPLGDFTYDWTNPCRVNIYFKKLPLADIINIGISTVRDYYEDDSGSSVQIHQAIDRLRIGSFGLSRGIALTSLDFSKQISPLYGSSMAGMDIVKVDVYRGGNYLNVTVRLSDEGWFDDTISDTMRRRCSVWFERESGRYVYPEDVAMGWTNNGTVWCRVVDIGSIQESDNPISSIEVKSSVSYDIIIDPVDKIKEKYGLSWDVDACAIEIGTDGIS